jgi:hypothetical protein
VPYKRVGNNVMHLKGGKWTVKQRCKSPTAAESAIRLLRGIEHGMVPRKNKRKK